MLMGHAPLMARVALALPLALTVSSVVQCHVVRRGTSLASPRAIVVGDVARGNVKCDFRVLRSP